jgi:hypothetical protein
VTKQFTIRNGKKFLQHVIPAILKPLHTLWNEVIGFLFLSFAAIFGFRTVAYIRLYLTAPPATANAELIRLAMAGCCTVLMAYYGVSSFRRARKISRS